MLNIVLFGPPGAGKGTQSEKIIEKYKLIHVSTGDLFRKHLSEGTELGLLAKKYMNEGHLVPDEVVIDMVKEKINENRLSSGFILDGFPRTVPQAEALDAFLKQINAPVKGMIALEVTDEELRTRLLERGKTSGRADDQDIEKVNTRIQVYHNETKPVADYYNKQNKYHGIYGIGAIDTIFNNICKAIDTFNK
ncbi:MAG: adenylate kinase [Bacteroidia bacterium]|nr:adenylate kinase [Bacteroidia bacterium]